MTDEQPSSIGRINQPYFDEGNNRVKALYTKVVESESELENAVRDLRNLREDTNAERITARFIIRDGVTLPYNIEARIPLNKDLNGHSLIYFGENKIERKSQPRALKEEVDFVKSIREDPIVDMHAVKKRISDEGYTIERLTCPTESDLEQITETYSKSFGSYTYELNPENVRKLVTSPNNIVAVARTPEREIVSIGVMETAKFPVYLNGSAGLEFRFAELSDAATRPEFRAKGLYTATSIMLHEIVAEQDFDLVYGEARACNFGVNKSCQKIGRKYYGTLEKHCIISGTKDVSETGPYENLNVWALNNKQLKELFYRSE